MASPSKDIWDSNSAWKLEALDRRDMVDARDVERLKRLPRPPLAPRFGFRAVLGGRDMRSANASFGLPGVDELSPPELEWDSLELELLLSSTLGTSSNIVAGIMAAKGDVPLPPLSRLVARTYTPAGRDLATHAGVCVRLHSARLR